MNSIAWAVPEVHRSLTKKTGRYVRDGVVTGGKASDGASLLGLRRDFSAKAGIERIVVETGDKEGKPKREGPGYFQVSVDAARRRAVVELAQLRHSMVSEPQVRDLFKGSPYVRHVELTLDPEDKSAALILHFNRPMKVEVFQLKKSKRPGRIVMDLTPVKPGKRKG